MTTHSLANHHLAAAGVVCLAGSLLLTWSAMSGPSTSHGDWTEAPKLAEMRPAMIWVSKDTADGLQGSTLAGKEQRIGATSAGAVEWRHWAAVMGGPPPTDPGGRVSHADVSVDAARLYCNRLALYEGLEPCYRLDGCAITPESTWRIDCRISGGVVSRCSGYALEPDPSVDALMLYRVISD